MPLCSAVIAGRSPDLDPLLDWLVERPGVTIGPSLGASVAIVVEASSTAELSELLRIIAARDDVAGVFPVYHSFEDELDARDASRGGPA